MIHPGEQREEAMWGENTVGEETGDLDTLEEHLYPEDCVDNLESEARITEDVFGLTLQYSCLENPMDRGAW